MPTPVLPRKKPSAPDMTETKSESRPQPASRAPVPSAPSHPAPAHSTTHSAPAHPAPSSGAAKPRRFGRTALRILLLVVVPAIGIAAAAYLYLAGGRFAETEDAYTKADTVQISADVSARVVAIEVRDNQPVKAGQVLFRLDDETFRIALAKAEAKLSKTRNDLTALSANYHQKENDLKSAQADLSFWNGELARQQKLDTQGFTPKSTVDQTRRAFDMARAQVAGDQRAIEAIGAQLDGNPDLPVEQHAAYKEALAERDQAALDLRHTVVSAPADGIVGQVPNLQIGSYLAAGTPAFTLVRTDHIWVEANMKETDLTYVRAGQPVTVTIDTYPGREWKGTVASLSPASGNELSVLPAQNSSGNWVKIVQRIPVRIELQLGPKTPPLSTGMSAVVEIDTGHRRNLPLVGRAEAENGDAGE
jgi:membrane fusion protein, multidrug efflux system